VILRSKSPRCVVALIAAVLAAAPAFAQSVVLTENFTTVAQTTGGWNLSSGFWPAQNNSTNPQPYSTNGGAWGPGGGLLNPAPGGAYFATDTTATGTDNGTVSDWLMTPVLTLHNGDILKFSTRTRNPEEGPSRLEVRLSTAGSGTSVGTLPADLGSFTTLVGTINPSLTANTYPTAWTTETFTVSGLSSIATGRLAFRTTYPNGGFNGPNGDTVGLAQVTYTATTGLKTLTWTGNVNGNWSNSGNWTPTGFPASSGDTQLTFGATPNRVMLNDLSGGVTVNSLTFNNGSPAYILSGNAVNFQTNSTGGLPQLVTNSANGLTIAGPITLTNDLTINGTGSVTVNGAIGGPAGLTMNSTGTLILGNGTNSYAGGTTILGGTVQISADGDLGTGNVTGAAGAVLAVTGSLTTTKSFAMNNGIMTVAAGQTLTLNGSTVSGVQPLDGPGTVATTAGAATRFVNVTTTQGVTIVSNSAQDQFVHITNNASFNVAAGLNTAGTSTTLNFDGFTNEASGSITIGAGSRVNVANFQSYGMLTLTPAAAGSGQSTRITNLGTAPLGFNGGSQTFLATPATAGQNLALLDLHGQNAMVAGGLFVNNGFVGDSTGSGAAIVADYGALVKGAGVFQSAVITQNGGKFQAGNSPGKATFGSLTLGPGGTQNFNWQINNATGVAGPSADANGQVSGWSLLSAEKQIDPLTGQLSSGDLTWTATSTPGNQFNLSLQTLANPTTVGQDVQGSMANFDGLQGNYSWKFISWQGNYSGPTNDFALGATVLIDMSNFVNPTDPNEKPSLHYNAAAKEIDLVWAIPEPSTLALTGLASLFGVWRYRRRRRIGPS
jgi:autotransporter-associated beta strand protein